MAGWQTVQGSSFPNKLCTIAF